MTAIIGLSAFYHDSAAALIIDGEIIAAAQEERFTRIKHDPSYPRNAISYLLSEAKLSINDIDKFVFYDKPFLKFERLLETYISEMPRGFKQFSIAMPIWLKEKLFLKKQILIELKQLNKNFDPNDLYFSEHHFSHAASAFYPSPFKEAVVLTLDGVGEWATTSVAIGKGKDLDVVQEINFPHSLGLLYSAFTYYTGFKVNSGEYKLMGLAPYGKPIYANIILDNLIDVKLDGSFRLNQDYFNYTTGLTMTNDKFSSLFGKPVRKPDVDKIETFHMDIAASIQQVTENIILCMTNNLSKQYNIPNLCMAGGVALNCVANGKILQAKHFKNIWIQPASGDAGGALGAALAVWHKEMKQDRKINKLDNMKGSFLGPSFLNKDIELELNKCNAKFEFFDTKQMLEVTADALAKGMAIGWFQGRMEFGPRSLGSRSIIADPRSNKMQKNLNLKVKFRESFRPFAPAILKEDVKSWFDLKDDSPYMLFVDKVKTNKLKKISNKDKDLFGIDQLNVVRSEIPAVTHVDFSARIQTVHKETNPLFHKLIQNFKKITNCPILVNTSFNIRGEPIVCSPTEAFNCFMGTKLDMLVIGNYVLKKEKQLSSNNISYKDRYELD